MINFADIMYLTSTIISNCTCSDQNMMMWIGTNSNKGRLNCSSSESDRCLTECYSKPEQTTQCSSNGKVYLKCG